MTPLDASVTRPLEGGASFPLRNRLRRVIWGITWLILARFTPPQMHVWRAAILRMFGARIGAGARVHGSAQIWLPAYLELGANALIGPGVRLYNQGRITVGARSVISQRAHLCASTHALDDPDFQLVLRPIIIGSECWVAAEAFVGPGVTMHDRSVLAARAALFEDAESAGVYRGNPAVKVKARKLP
ncbi:putative colanic acid biosynthesis acetyltransferase [Novosphingobium sp.]|uniref:putative colanic acid biosynthesis acetyltransferase n=1 Tax=Novosphingobium sp. TaxID=1874826 RepID=UPI0025F50500|nr:putative colanic acid biosynthesis acetyltransferase [Novosphingobium sp.]